MKARHWHWSLGSVAGCLIASVLYGAVWATRGGDAESLLLAAVAGSLSGGVAALLTWLQLRRWPPLPAVPVPAAPEPPATSLPESSPLPEAFPLAAALPQSVKPKRRQAPFVARTTAARLSPELHWERLSKPLQKLLGRSGKKLRGASILDFIHAEDRIVIERRFRNPSKVAFDAKFRLVLPARKGKPETQLYVQLTAAPLRDDQGKLTGWRALFFDVTRQVEGEASRQRHLAELAQAHEKAQRIQRQLDRLKNSYFDLYHDAPVMYFSLDAEGRFVTFNDALLRKLGYDRDELLGRKYQEIVTHTNSTPVPFELPTDDKEEEWETQWRRKDGEVMDVLLRTIAVFDERGKVSRWRSSALDYTERNQLAKKLRAHTEQLENTNARLRHINSELEDFTHVVSHDLKEPLRTIMLHSNMLAEDFSSQLSTDGFQSVNYLLHASRRLAHLIDDLLKLSHAGRSANAPQPFNLIEAVATSRRDLVDLIQRKEATILTEGTLPTVVGDPQRITQLLTNLIANGLKYNKNATPRVTIGQHLQGADDRQAIIYVRDNGIGIDPKDHLDIFGLFRRLKTDDEFEGTGAGLAICKKIVEAHGGRIWVDSRPGQGATFFFTLPKPAPSPTRNGRGPRSPSPSPPATPSAPSHGLHILLVEDLPEYGTIIQKLGQRSGLEITWFKTGTEAWDWLQDTQPNFLLLDIQLPDMNGMELCRRIRNELMLDVPIALISGQLPVESAKLREIGADHFLSKDLLSEPAKWQKKLDEVIASSLKPVAATV